jgi:hypothetical protein
MREDSARVSLLFGIGLFTRHEHTPWEWRELSQIRISGLLLVKDSWNAL